MGKELMSIKTEIINGAKKMVKPEIEQQVFEMYQSGMSSYRVAEKLGIGSSTVCRIVKRLDGKVRTNSEARGITSEIEQEVLEMYQGGMSSSQVAEKLGIGSSTVCRIVKRLDGKVRTNSEAKGVSTEIEQQVFEMYKFNINSYQIAEKLGISHATVGNIVRRLGGKIRTKSEAQTKAISKVKASQYFRLYEAGYSSRQIAEAYGVSSSTIHGLLKRSGYKLRSLSEANELSCNPKNLKPLSILPDTPNSMPTRGRRVRKKAPKPNPYLENLTREAMEAIAQCQP